MLEAGSEHSRFRKRLSLHTAGQGPNMDARAQATEAGGGSGPGGWVPTEAEGWQWVLGPLVPRPGVTQGQPVHQHRAPWPQGTRGPLHKVCWPPGSSTPLRKGKKSQLLTRFLHKRNCELPPFQTWFLSKYNWLSYQEITLRPTMGVVSKRKPLLPRSQGLTLKNRLSKNKKPQCLTPARKAGQAAQLSLVPSRRRWDQGQPQGARERWLDRHLLLGFCPHLDKCPSLAGGAQTPSSWELDPPREADRICWVSRSHGPSRGIWPHLSPAQPQIPEHGHQQRRPDPSGRRGHSCNL